MRAKIHLIATVPALLLALLTGAQAQPASGPPQPNTSAGAPAQPPTAAAPNPQSPNPQAPDMATYRGMLQKAADDLRHGIEQAETGASTTQRGATPPAVMQVMHTASEARHVVERAPASFTGNPVYNDVLRDMRGNYSDIIARDVSAQKAIEGARGTLQALERLQQAAAQAS